MATTKEKVVFHKDEKHEQMIREEVQRIRNNYQSLVDNFKALDLGTIDPQNFTDFVFNPQELAYKRWEDAQETPKGWKRDKYLDILVKPDHSHLVPQQNTIPNHDIFYLEGWTVKVNEDIVNEFAESQDIAIEEDSDKYQVFLMLQDLEKRMNDLNSKVGLLFDVEDGKNLREFFKQGDKRFSDTPKIELDHNKILSFLRRDGLYFKSRY